MHFQCVTYVDTPYHKKPCHTVMNFNNICRSFLGNYFNNFSLSDLCLEAERMLLWNNTVTPYHKNSYLRGHEFYNFTILILYSNELYTQFIWSNIYYVLSSSDLCPRVEKKILKEYIKYRLFTQKLSSLGMMGREYTNSCLFVLQMLHTDAVNALQTTHVVLRQTHNTTPEWLRWPKNEL